MKLPIKKEYFDLIKSGKKKLEFRDAHITFVCEETGETLKKYVKAVDLCPKSIIVCATGLPDKLFDDEKIITFTLK